MERSWKNYRVIGGHSGWVRSVAVDPTNTWFCTGSADRTIKIWDLASGMLNVTLTDHVEQIRALAVRNKNIFSAGDDKQVKCWDLEQNKVIHSFHGHLSSVYCVALHPTMDLLFTGSRDCVCRVWDIRTKTYIHAFTGHENTVSSVLTLPLHPQVVVTASHDSTIKLWDIRYGETMETITHHNKSIRAMAQHGSSFASASIDGNIKKFSLPEGQLLQNMVPQHRSIVNSMSVNDEGVMATGGDNGSLWFWDWTRGHNFQQTRTMVQPGSSMDSEAAIYALTYDVTGTKLVTCEADNTIKMWKQDEIATTEV